jgi:hypothetical protein
MAPPVIDYASLTNALADYAHRADIITALGDGVVPSDYFIQAAIEAVQNDIPDLNFGNYVQWMENAYAPSLIAGGTLPVPADWLAPKVLYISDGSSDQWPLIFKSPAWLSDRYPVRQPSGLPAYIARDVLSAASFTASISGGNAIITAIASGLIQTGQILAGAGIPSGPGAGVIISGSITSGTQGGIGTYPVSSVAPIAPTLAVGSQAMSAGGSVFVFGPYPDSAYQMSGTYYQAIPALSSSATTNWLTEQAPMMLHAACMLEVAKFLENDPLIARWTAVYQPRLKALVDRDKAERWAPSVMQIETA